MARHTTWPSSHGSPHTPCAAERHTACADYFSCGGHCFAACLQLASSLWLAAILSGCASQQTFRVVDARSGEPLGDVRVERLEGGYRPSAMPFMLVNELSPIEKQTTNESGSVTFTKSGSSFMVNPSGANPAYNDAYVKATWSGAKVCYPGQYREFSVARKDGVVEIPLHRRDPLVSQGIAGDDTHAAH